jgi:pimeloyl-ACP methyl ester carboxylesterase
VKTGAGTAAVVAAWLALAAPAQALPRFAGCGPFGFECTRVSVPLDRSGAVPGRVSLFVKRVRARERPRRGALVVLAGGPGQSATDAFGGSALSVLHPAYRHRDLIIFDQRGTGRSGLLRCRALERANLLDAGTAAGRCAGRLGPRRAFYTSRDSAEDIEAIRVALDYESIALFGTSYGTKVALGYALSHPESVERLVLDSVVEADGPNPLYLDTLEAVPRVLQTLCRARCREFTPDPVADLATLVRRLARRPMRGPVVGRDGAVRRSALRRADLFVVLVAGDLNPALRAAFPGAVRAALDDDAAPLLRLRDRAYAVDGTPPPPRVLSTALYAATTCEETPFPWSRTSPPDPAARRAAARSAAAALPDIAFFPFDRPTAVDNDLVDLCERWLAAPNAPGLGPGPLPDVPVLLLEGEDDLRTPIENARRVAAGFPRARLVVAPATGHSALGGDVSGCTTVAFGRFMQGAPFSTRCRRAGRDFLPSPPPPRGIGELRAAAGVPGARGRVLAAISLTLHDLAFDAITGLITEAGARDFAHGGGLRAGSYRLDTHGSLTLRRLAFVPDVRLDGRIRSFIRTPRQRGRIRVEAARGVPGGTVTIRGRRVRGILGGEQVAARLDAPFAAAARAAAAAAQRGASPAKNVASIAGNSSSSTASGSSSRSSATPFAIANVISATWRGGTAGSMPSSAARASSSAAIRSRSPR